MSPQARPDKQRVLYSSTNYGTSGQSNVLSAGDITTAFASGSYRVDVFIDNPIGGFQPIGVGPAVAQIYDVYLDVTHQDGTISRLRPTSTSMSGTRAGIRHHYQSRQCPGWRPVYLCHADALLL
jgi:hypothetical protein